MTRAYRSPGSELHGDPRLRKAVFASLDYWLKHDLQCPNWWSNKIGGPQLLAPVLLLLDDELSEQERSKGTEVLRRGTLGSSGQNLIWVADITVMRGVFENRPEVVEEAYRRIAGELSVQAKRDGIQSDYSFHQHGPCLYSHGYGSYFATDVARVAAQAAGTRFALPDECVRTFANLILDGHQWFIYGLVADPGALGRQITRDDNSVTQFVQVAKNMLQLPTGREAEFRALARRIAGDPDVPLVGNRHFWRSDIMVHRRPGFSTSARMFSSRTYSTDTPCNDEGLRSHHLADGCNYFFRNGREYFDVFAAWDWRKIPGTTVTQTPDLRGEVRRRGTSNFVGGVSDGQFGLAALDLVRDSLRARKAWVFFDKEYVCLGAGITDDSGYPVATTVNQCLLAGPVMAGNGKETRLFEPGTRTLDNTTWLHHDRVTYYFPEPTPLQLSNETRMGNRWSMNHRYSDEPIIRDVFALWVDHGKHPNDASYCYVVMPDVKVADLKARSFRPAVTILRNDSKLQAVRQNELKITGAAFYGPGSLVATEGLTLTVDQPCLLLLREQGDRLAITVSNPKNESLDVVVEVQRETPDTAETKAAGTRVVFSLPEGLQAGSSVTKHIAPPSRCLADPSAR